MVTGLLRDRREFSAVAAILAINFCLSLYTELSTLRNFPNSADEYAYVLSARLFAEGTLSSPSPEPRAFFQTIHVLNQGRVYGKYPPGWPALLALGFLAGVPWLVNPLLGTCASILIYRIARDHFPAGTGFWTAVSMLACPFLIFNSASYFSHPACLFFLVSGAFWALRGLERPNEQSTFLFAGLSIGLAFLVRPYTACAIGGALGAFLCVLSGSAENRDRRWGHLVAAVGPVILCVGGLLAYDYRLTGDPFLQPFAQYDPGDHPRLPGTWKDLSYCVHLNLWSRLWDLAVWIPVSIVFVPVYFAFRSHRGSRISLLLLALFVAQVSAQFFYTTPPGNQYGPRYWYESSFVVLVFMGGVLRRMGKGALIAGVILVGLNGYAVHHQSAVFAAQIHERMLPYDLADQAHLSQAVVFLRTGSGSMPAGDLTRNGTRFDGPVWYVHDRGSENASLMLEHPERSCYTYEFDPETASGRLRPVPPMHSEKSR